MTEDTVMETLDVDCFIMIVVAGLVAIFALIGVAARVLNWAKEAL